MFLVAQVGSIFSQLVNQMDDWFGSKSNSRPRKRKHALQKSPTSHHDYITPNPKRGNTSQIDNTESINSACEGVSKEEGNSMVDKDYTAHLQLLIENAQSSKSEECDEERSAEDDVDPDYKLLLENRKEEEDSMADKDYMAYLQLVIENGDLYTESKKKSGECDFVGCDDKKSVEDDVDPAYRLFLENVREYGYSYVFEMKEEDGRKVTIKYEEEEGVDDFFAEMPITDTLDTGFGKTNGCAVKNSDLTTPHWFLAGCKLGTLFGADDSYLKYLNHVWVDGDSLTYKHGDIIIKYGDETGVVAHSEEPEQRGISCENGKLSTPCTNYKMNEDYSDSDSVQILDGTTVKIDYKLKLEKKLRDVLQKPFDAKEFQEKMEAANDHKPLQRTRVTRQRSVSYPTDRISDSYLDLHPDLANMLKGALREGVPHRALAILRCLFFYYENLSHQGFFVPWRSPSSWLHDIICCCPGDSDCPATSPISHSHRYVLEQVNEE